MADAAVLPPVRAKFRALARAIVPEAAELDEQGWGDLEAIVEDALSIRPPNVRRQFGVFIRLLSWLPLLRYGRTFGRLSDHRRARFLHGMETSRLLLFRRGFWGLRSLVYMGYYGRADGYRAVSYDARLRGWLEHPAGTEAARHATVASAADVLLDLQAP